MNALVKERAKAAQAKVAAIAEAVINGFVGLLPGGGVVLALNAALEGEIGVAVLEIVSCIDVVKLVKVGQAMLAVDCAVR
jgi:hypothetical protein